MDAFELWCWRRLLSPLDYKEIQPVHPKDQSWVFIGRTDAETETPVLWPPHAKSWFIGKDPDAGRDCGQEKGTTEDEMAGWHHRLDGHEFGWTPGVGNGQGGLVCCDSWGRKVGHDWATELNWTELRSKTRDTAYYPTNLIMNFFSAKTRPGVDCGSVHELLIAKFRLKLNKVGKTTRPFRSDQIRSVAQLCPTLCNPMNCSTPGLPVHHQLPWWV